MNVVLLSLWIEGIFHVMVVLLLLVSATLGVFVIVVVVSLGPSYRLLLCGVEWLFLVEVSILAAPIMHGVVSVQTMLSLLRAICGRILMVSINFMTLPTSATIFTVIATFRCINFSPMSLSQSSSVIMVIIIVVNPTLVVILGWLMSLGCSPTTLMGRWSSILIEHCCIASVIIMWVLH